MCNVEVATNVLSTQYEHREFWEKTLDRVYFESEEHLSEVTAVTENRVIALEVDERWKRASYNQLLLFSKKGAFWCVVFGFSHVDAGVVSSRIPSNILWHDNAPVSISTSRLLSDFKIDPPS